MCISIIKLVESLITKRIQNYLYFQINKAYNNGKHVKCIVVILYIFY